MREAETRVSNAPPLYTTRSPQNRNLSAFLILLSSRLARVLLSKLQGKWNHSL